MRSGFSLVELSIVLVILGLLTGGILTGQNLIRAAELRSVVTDLKKYHTAVMIFKDKYFATPGDMRNATDFWGSAGGTGADAACVAAQTSSLPTCNGNGNGTVDAPTSVERFLSWKHLAGSGLVEGSYTGKTNGAAGSYLPVPGLNVPKARVSATAYFDMSAMVPAPAFYFAESNTSHNALILYGDPSGGYGAIAPEEAWNVDTKLDDGSPVTGNIYTTINSSSVGGGCADSDVASAVYNVQSTAKSCALFFVVF